VRKNCANEKILQRSKQLTEDCSRADRLDGVDLYVEVSGLSDTKRHGKDYPTDFEMQRPSLSSDAGVCPLRASPVRMSGVTGTAMRAL
jgi:hypothetical protein